MFVRMMCKSYSGYCWWIASPRSPPRPRCRTRCRAFPGRRSRAWHDSCRCHLTRSTVWCFLILKVNWGCSSLLRVIPVCHIWCRHKPIDACFSVKREEEISQFHARWNLTTSILRSEILTTMRNFCGGYFRELSSRVFWRRSEIFFRPFEKWTAFAKQLFLQALFWALERTLKTSSENLWQNPLEKLQSSTQYQELLNVFLETPFPAPSRRV